MVLMTNWIRTAEHKPEKGEKVLAWHPERGFEICRIDGTGVWCGSDGTCVEPTHWLALPDPPADQGDETLSAGISGKVVDGRLLLDIDEDKETVAALMQHYLRGDAAVVNGARRFIVDMKNEMIDGKMVSVFILGE